MLRPTLPALLLSLAVTFSASAETPAAAGPENPTQVEKVHLANAVDKTAVTFVKQFLSAYGANQQSSLEKIADDATIQIALHQPDGKSRTRVFEGKDYKSVALNQMVKDANEKRRYRFYSVTMRTMLDGTGFQVIGRRLDIKDRLITPFSMEISERPGKGMKVQQFMLHERDTGTTPLTAPATPALQ